MSPWFPRIKCKYPSHHQTFLLPPGHFKHDTYISTVTMADLLDLPQHVRTACPRFLV